jgi:hypothetical protein
MNAIYSFFGNLAVKAFHHLDEPVRRPSKEDFLSQRKFIEYPTRAL